MSDLTTLRDAFDHLEERAERAAAEFARPLRRAERRRARVLAPVGAAAAVAASAVAVVVWQSGGGPPATPAAGSSAPIADPSGGSATRSSAPSTVASTAAAQFPPSTAAALTSRAREILGRTATIRVTEGHVPGAVQLTVPAGSPAASGSPSIAAGPGVRLPAGSGASIVGILTSDKGSGGFQLVAFQSDPGTKALCDGDTDCAVHALPDGSSLAVGSWHDPQVAGGVTYQVEVVRPDGGDILLHLSTERDPKGESSTISSVLPLTVEQMTALVTSDRW